MNLVIYALWIGVITAPAIWGVTLDYYRISTTPWAVAPDGGCITPSDAPSHFLTTDSQAHLWFAVLDGNAGDMPVYQLYQPDGTLYATGSWNPLASGGYWCFQWPLNITGEQPGSLPGTWSYKVLWNGTPLFTLSFSIEVPARRLWVYGSDGTRTLGSPPKSELQDFIVVLQRRAISTANPGLIEYQLSVLGDNLITLDSATLTIVRDLGVDIQGPSLAVSRNVNIPGGGIRNNIVANRDSGWRPLSQFSSAPDKVFALFRDLVSFVPAVGDVLNAADIVTDIGAFLPAASDVSPSDTFILKLNDFNSGHSNKLAALKLKPSASTDLAYGVRFVFAIDESQVGPRSPLTLPWFFLMAKNYNGTIVGLELQDDRSAPLTSRH